MTVNDIKMRGRSDATSGGVGTRRPTASPRPPISEEDRPERVPCAGNGNGTSLNNSGSNGNYWSSVPNSDSNNANELNFNSGNHNTNNNNRNNGQSVRPVQEFAAGPGDAVPHCGLLADLIEAYHDARRHKRGRPYQTRFEMNQERELVNLRDELLERRYTARPCSCFIIHDPKMREVFAAEFRDRVVHHLFYNYTHELFERTFIADSYSCIEGRGTHYGVERLKHHLLSCSQNWTKPCYVLKLDIKGYFMSINRARLLARCRELLGCVRRGGGRGATALPGCGMVVRRGGGRGATALPGCGMVGTAPRAVRELDWPLVDYLLESICMLDPVANCRIIGDRDEWKLLPKEKSLFNSRPGCGLPIGNLSSQLFSNIYLGAFDDFMKRELKCRHYGRYVDDAYVVASSKEELWSIVPKAREFLRDELELELNEAKVRVIDARRGVEFLGAYVKPYRTYPANKALRRMRGRLKSLDWSEGPDKTQARVNSMLGVLSHYDCWHVRKVLAWEARLREHGRVTDDCLRFEPDAIVFDIDRAAACAARPPYRAERHAGLLERAQGRTDVLAGTAHGKDVARGAFHLVDDARCVLHDEFADVVAVDFRHDASGSGKVRQLGVCRGDNPVRPCRGDLVAAAFAFNPVLAVPEAFQPARRPFDGERNGFHSRPSARSMARTSSVVYVSPRSLSSSAARTSSMSSRVSRSSYGAATSQSTMLSTTDVGRPFCVTMMGRCVRRVFSRYSPSLPRHSVKEITSSERMGRRGPGRSARRVAARAGCALDCVFVRMFSAPCFDADSVPYSRLIVQGGVCDSRTGCQPVHKKDLKARRPRCARECK